MIAAKRALLKLAIVGTLAGGAMTMPLIASAAPSNFPDNPNACVGYSSTTANAQFQTLDPDKFRADQAHGDWGPFNEQGRRDDVNAIPQCDGIR